jgi:hypothetical protein
MTLEELSEKIIKLITTNPSLRDREVFIYEEGNTYEFGIGSGFSDDENNFVDDLDEVNDDEMKYYEECTILYKEGFE